MKSSAPSARPTKISAVRVSLAARALRANVAERAVDERLVRPADAIGDHRPGNPRRNAGSGRSSRWICGMLRTDRWIASVAPLRPSVDSSSPSGIADDFIAVRVRITVWLISGSVSSV